VKWTQPSDIKSRIQRLWQRGEICRAAVADSELFPFELRLKQPTAQVMLDDWVGVQDWVKVIQAFAQKQEIPLDWHTVNHRALGRQKLPHGLRWDTPQQAAKLLGQASSLKRFETLYHQGIKRLPELQAWMLQYPLKVLELSDAWQRLLAVCEWMKQHPNPRIYLRQVDVSGVDSKFIEAHRKVLGEWFELMLPVFAINDDFSGGSGFAQRYGFLDKPAMIRLRPLDADISLLNSDGSQDVVMTDKALAKLHGDVHTRVERVFIIENEVNYLAFPDVPRALLIFGKGYGFEALKQVQWLHDCAMYYWGDLDTHGFAILNQLRAHFPHVQSFLMDKDTLLNHQYAWGVEPKQERKDLQHLTHEEYDVYDILRENSLVDKLRLEQERIVFSQVLQAVEKIVHQEHGEKT